MSQRAKEAGEQFVESAGHPVLTLFLGNEDGVAVAVQVFSPAIGRLLQAAEAAKTRPAKEGCDITLHGEPGYGLSITLPRETLLSLAAEYLTRREDWNGGVQ